jgi:hypothetical protein
MDSAFDLSEDKKQNDFSLDTNRHTMEESFEIVTKNYKRVGDVKTMLLRSYHNYRHFPHPLHQTCPMTNPFP